MPQFFELLTQQQDQFDLAITGKQDAKTTLDNIAKFQQNLLTEAGLIQYMTASSASGATASLTGEDSPPPAFLEAVCHRGRMTTSATHGHCLSRKLTPRQP